MLAVELRRTLRNACKNIHRAAKPHQKRAAGRFAVLRHEKLLLGCAEAHKRHIRAARFDLLSDGRIFLKVAVVRTGNHKAGKTVFEVFRRLFGNARLRAE